MAVDDPDQIDAIGVERTTGAIVLTITDHLPWDDASDHLTRLHEKLNRYLEFVENGQIFDAYPEAKRNSTLRIDVQCLHPPLTEGLHFLERARDMIVARGMDLRWVHDEQRSQKFLKRFDGDPV